MYVESAKLRYCVSLRTSYDILLSVGADFLTIHSSEVGIMLVVTIADDEGWTIAQREAMRHVCNVHWGWDLKQPYKPSLGEKHSRHHNTASVAVLKVFRLLCCVWTCQYVEYSSIAIYLINVKRLYVFGIYTSKLSFPRTQ